MPQPDTKIVDQISSINIADSLDADQLLKIGREAQEGFKNDLLSRADWDETASKALDIALLTAKARSWPWANASNVKYPLVATAAMQFSARAYPSLVPGNEKIVKTEIIGGDKDGAKKQKASKIERVMSYQIFKDMDNWEEEMDKGLYILAIVGNFFKKTYFHPGQNKNVSKIVYPRDLVVNYWSKSLETAARVSEIMEMTVNDVVSRKRKGIFLDIELPQPTVYNSQLPNTRERSADQPSVADSATPYKIIEQHTWLDLDDDDYMEPYIVTFEESSGKVLRITARYDLDGVQTNADGEISEITPLNYYTKFGFFPNPDGGFYDIGFGSLLGPLNAAVDSAINQLVDAGTLSNLQGGFISKGIKLKAGEQPFTPGEWKLVNNTMDDIKKGVFPLPVREPSEVLLKLATLLIQSGKELASIAEIFVGKMPGQNTPAYTTKESVEQGMKLFTAVYKRVYRSLAQEFKKLFALNAKYLDEAKATTVLDEPVSRADFDPTLFDIIPAADPSAASEAEQASKFQQVLQLLPLGLNPIAVATRGLQTLKVENPEELLPQGPPPPNPEIEAKKAEMQLEQNKAQFDMQLKQADMQMKASGQAQKQKLEQEKARMTLQKMAQEAALKQQISQIEMQGKAAQTVQNVQANQLTHAQKLRHADEAAKQKSKEKANGPKQTAKRQTKV